MGSTDCYDLNAYPCLSECRWANLHSPWLRLAPHSGRGEMLIRGCPSYRPWRSSKRGCGAALPRPPPFANPHAYGIQLQTPSSRWIHLHVFGLADCQGHLGQTRKPPGPWLSALQAAFASGRRKHGTAAHWSRSVDSSCFLPCDSMGLDPNPWSHWATDSRPPPFSHTRGMVPQDNDDTDSLDKNRREQTSSTE